MLFGWSRYLDYKSIIADRVIHSHPVLQSRGFDAIAGISGATIAFGFRDILENLLAGILILLLAPADGYKPRLKEIILLKNIISRLKYFTSSRIAPQYFNQIRVDFCEQSTLDIDYLVLSNDRCIILHNVRTKNSRYRHEYSHLFERNRS
ncbi:MULTISPECIES: hypothetical protein [unclassified Microcoleus]|uniref:hypothetical protein n=1 Tax=unclassified Microcoleus TaxID=2642155 RepID=UPI002FD55559